MHERACARASGVGQTEYLVAAATAAAEFAMAESAAPPDLPELPDQDAAGITPEDIRQAKRIVDSVESCLVDDRRQGSREMGVFLDFSGSMAEHDRWKRMRELLMMVRDHVNRSGYGDHVFVVPFGPSFKKPYLPSRFESLREAIEFCIPTNMNCCTNFMPYGAPFKGLSARALFITDGDFTDESIHKMMEESPVPNVGVVVLGTSAEITRKLRTAATNCVWKNLKIWNVACSIDEISESLGEWLSMPQYVPNMTPGTVIIGGLMVKPGESTATYVSAIRTLLETGRLNETKLEVCSIAIIDTLKSLGDQCATMVDKQPWFSVFNSALLQVSKSHSALYSSFSQQHRSTQQTFKKAHVARAVGAFVPPAPVSTISVATPAPPPLPWTATCPCRNQDDAYLAAVSASSENAARIVCEVPVVFDNHRASVSSTLEAIGKSLQIFSHLFHFLSAPKLCVLAMLLLTKRLPSLNMTEQIASDLRRFVEARMPAVRTSALQGAVLSRVPSPFELLAFGDSSLLLETRHPRATRALYISAFNHVLRHLPQTTRIAERQGEIGHRRQLDGTVSLCVLKPHEKDPAPGFPSVVLVVCQHNKATCYYLEQRVSKFADDMYTCSYNKFARNCARVLGSLSLSSQGGADLLDLLSDLPAESPSVARARARLQDEWTLVSNGVDIATLHEAPVQEVSPDVAARVMQVAEQLAVDLGMAPVVAECIYTEMERRCVISTALHRKTRQYVPPEFQVETFLTSGTYDPDERCARILPQVETSVDYRCLLEQAEAMIDDFLAPLASLATMDHQEASECPICYNDLVLIGPCPCSPALHLICGKCFQSILSSDTPHCPICRTPYIEK